MAWFHKNKIEAQIKDQVVENTSDDFQSLNTVIRKLHDRKWVQKLFVKPYNEATANIQDKFARTTKYIKTHQFNLYRGLNFLLIFATLILGFIITFQPYYGGTVGATLTNVSNFYTAILVNDNIFYNITNLGIGFVVLLLLTAVTFGFYCYWANKKGKLFLSLNKISSILSKSIYGCFGITFLFILLGILIPPNAQTLVNLQIFNNNIAIIFNNIQNSSAPNQAVADAINNIYKLYNLAPPSGTPSEMLTAFMNDYTQNLLFAESSYFSHYSFIFTVHNGSLAFLSAGGISYLTFALLFLFAGIVVIPSYIYIANIIEKHKQLNNVLFYQRWIKQIATAFNAFRQIQWREIFKNLFKADKKTFAQYKKKIKSEGLDKNSTEHFKSEQVDNSISSSISKETIETHEANKAFLNENGDWMYHDGQQHYFIAKNDTWLPYDINQAIHKVHVDKANTEFNLSPTKKIAKKGFFNFGNKKSKPAGIDKNKSAIELPDDDLDDVLKSLDI